ncbi:MAG: hypothetical protein JXR03_04565 [Cyclobacteriaceae bacterium]
MDPFLMSIVSDSNHWMFISSNGGLTAGRKNAERALFPYYTDDKLTELYDTTGSKSIFWINRNGNAKIWEPFSERYVGAYSCSRNLYKNFYGNKIVFEEVNHDLELTFRYQWASSDKYGFVRNSFLVNHLDSDVTVRLIDGIQNIMPFGIPSNFQAIRSNLSEAYKRSELEESVGLGIYALSAIIVDRAEPSEALKANIAWSLGLNEATYLLSSSQLNAFRRGEELEQEVDVKAKKGSYFVSQNITLSAHEQRSWMIVANVNQTATSIAEISELLRNNNNLASDVLEDVERGSEKLNVLVSSSDGLQLTADKKNDARHYSNTLFNIMRGGIFDHNYKIEKWDFDNYLKRANQNIYQQSLSLLAKLPSTFSFQELKERARENQNHDFSRLALEYMPLKFSRRHGDPSRPWNQFSINTQSELDGSKVLDYEGNWRDIFQNWEALAYAYPEFIESMILKFLNASTFDGYNPYRVTKDGFDWEVIEEHDPWSYIGYWGDHQIIYLLKFLEFAQNHYPGLLASLFNKDHFVYANVPYKIKAYEELLKDPKDTILFDYDLDIEIRQRRDEMGADGALLLDKNGQVCRVNFIEKILATVLAKLSNFIPEAGIWLNTQRPEWNDANNALVGNGVSMVTLCYLRRFLNFLRELLQSYSGGREIQISQELRKFLFDTKLPLDQNLEILLSGISDKHRRQILDGLGAAGSEYRNAIYSDSFSGLKETVSIAELMEFVETGLTFVDHSIKANKRHDNMYHAYNLMTVENQDEISVAHLSEMLEGQVAVLSSGYLSAQESLELLDALKQSKLFRDDQYSYLLYPNKELPKFTDKNVIPDEKVESSILLQRLLQDGNTQILEKDLNGRYHFNGNFNNAESLKQALSNIASGDYAELVEKESAIVLQVFEDVFNHKAFTGRSGTFYGYEGLGSIYWHMVSKLLLAVEECCLRAVDEGQSDEIVGRLLEHYYEINEGIGVHKSPQLYGAFSIDPYSHTPSGKGAQQPGMTGQVKEDILSRIGELGVFVKEGQIHFSPCLLRAKEFLKKPGQFEYISVDQSKKTLEVGEGSLAFTYCQVPVIYQIAEKDYVELIDERGSTSTMDTLVLDFDSTQKLFRRTSEIACIHVFIKKTHLK